MDFSQLSTAENEGQVTGNIEKNTFTHMAGAAE
jgi:hypothetical protein